jgi:Tol biopolymer transport system component
MTRTIGGNADLWLQDLSGAGALTKLTTSPRPDIYPVWAPDGRRLAYGMAGDKSFALGTVATDGHTSVLYDGPVQEIPLDWSRDDRYILYRSQRMGEAVESVDLWAFPLDNSGTPIPVAQTPADERAGAFSPDSKWVAFESNETGRYEIYVQSFPNPGAKTIVSSGGGRQVRWSPRGRELFYVAPDGRLMSVSLTPRTEGQAVEPAAPVALFRTRILGVPTGGTAVEYDVSRDGRFLMNTLVEQPGAPITLIVNAAAASR